MGASTTSLATFLLSMRASKCSPSASAKDCPADRHDHATWSISMRENRVIVGDAEDLLVEEFEIDRVNWSSREASRRTFARDGQDSLQPSRCGGHAHPLEGTALSLGWRKRRKRSRRQAAVCYDGDVGVAGGWICRQAAVAAA